MSVRRWLLAGTVLTVGCASNYGVTDRDVARLPPQHRQQVITASRSIDVAQSNLETARVQRDEARQFRKIAMSELAAARSRLEAARAGIELGRSTRDLSQMRAAQRNEDVARDNLIAARAKLDYADRLLGLREARIDESEAALSVARADVAVQKARFLENDGITANIDHARIRKDEQEAQDRLAERRARGAALSGEVQQLRVAWEDRRREFNTASAAGVPSLAAPRARPMLDSRGDVNDTPAAPEVPESQERQNNIAPNP